MERFPFRGLPQAEAESLQESHIKTKEDGTKHVQLEFNVKEFKPEEINVQLDRYMITT